ncbi:MAG: COG1615 family transporter, partial [Clostridiales bacterium]|nr:COG1615 family transporter [Clostridiales bacterium]
MNKKRIGLTLVIIILVIILGIFGAMIGFITDFLWFRELGYTSVFFKQLFTQLKLGIPTFIILTGLSYVYLMGLKKGYYKRVDIADNPPIKERTLNYIALGISAIFGVLITLSTVTRLWFDILKFSNSTEFGIADPIFNMDISFYVFRLELITHANQILIGVIVAFVVLTLLFYSILLSMRRPRIFEEQ